MHIIFNMPLFFYQKTALTYQESNLYMRQARSENFRFYTIVAENSIGASSKEVELYKSMFENISHNELNIVFPYCLFHLIKM